MKLAIPLRSPAVQIIGDNLKINSVTGATTNFKVVTTPDTTTLEYYQSIYTHCKQRFNIPDGIEIVERTLYQYIENCINNYLLGNYNISEVRSNLYNNLVHYSQLRTEDLNSETLATYFQELNYNIIKYCEEKYPVQSKYSLDFESETETSNKSKQKVKQHSKTTSNTPILPKTTAKHLQTPEQGTSVKLPLFITSFPISLARPQTPNSPLNCFSRPEDFQSPRNPTQQQKPISTSTNIIEYLQENESDHSEYLESEKTESEQEKATENKEKIATAFIAKISEFTGKDSHTSPQEWLDKIQKTEDANEESDFQQTALSESRDTAPKSNLSNHTIPPAQIAQNANLSDIFSFEFETNESPFLLSNAAVNEQKAITAMYTEATVERKSIHLILDSRSVGRQYTIVLATCGTFNKQSEKALVFEFEEEKEMPITETYMALGLTSNWTKETEQKIFETREWKKVWYSTPESQKKPPYILLKCKDCKKKLSSIGACISPEEEYKTRICYFYKACHKEQFGSPKKNGKWNKTPCLTCGEMLPEECNWIDVAIRGGVCDQTCQYAL
ncbi:hypothetical protein G9A89_016294 [Geosiphon pyriformis]|nr:hypothetical protein G9A89_016294 [Geosiphon pyriformis]